MASLNIPKSHVILPSLLAANSMFLSEEITAVTQTGVGILHLDIMDNHYVPNLSFGPHIVKQINNCFP